MVTEQLFNIKGRSMEELESWVESKGHSRFRARQLFLWLNQKKVNDFKEMTDLSKGFRDELSHITSMPTLSKAIETPSEDGTIKYLIQLKDGAKVESVYIPTPGRTTLCVSTQVGCKMACTFCATGYQKFTRNLEAWEIVDQLLAFNFPKPITNIVLMGMGEPLDNYDAVVSALKIFSHPSGPQIGRRHITLSTVGLSNRIPEFMETGLARLAISLHATTQEQREAIMPITKKFPLEGLLETCRNLELKHRDRITFEYVLLENINDADTDALRLAKILRGIPSKINLLAYNENAFINYKRTSEERILKFQSILLNAGYTTTYRRSRGRDIAAACGQLHHQHARHSTQTS